MAEIVVRGNIGRLVKGHVFDTDKRTFDRALRAYDPLLYTVWNTDKFHGRGCWEVRRRPEFNSALDVCEFEGNLIFKVGPKEYDMIHHVLDTQFLNYDILRYLREQDTFQYGGSTPQERASKWQDARERRSRDEREKAAENGMKLRSEAARSFKNEIRAFKDYVRSGGNPHLIAQHWDRVKAAE